MKITKINNSSLTVLNIGTLSVAFSYREPIALMLNDTIFITEEHFSNTTEVHKREIFKLWNAKDKDFVSKETYQNIRSAVISDIECLINSKSNFLNQLERLK